MLFPTFINLQSKKVLVIGGGQVAQRKIEKLLPFGPKIHIVAPKINKDLLSHKKMGITFQKKKFRIEDLHGFDLVIAAINDETLQRAIFLECEKRKILCNAVDGPKYCNFIFPSLFTNGDLCIGISTSGKAPYVAVKIRHLLERVIPKNINQIIQQTEKFRNGLGSSVKNRTSQIRSFVDDLFKIL